jgi:hypothetical protein
MRGFRTFMIAASALCGGIGCNADRMPTPTHPSPDSITSIAITPDTAGIGGAPRFKAMATLANGQTVEITETASWQSSDSSVIEVRARGFAVARRSGTARVTASQQGITATQNVTTYPCISWRAFSTNGSEVMWVGESVLWRADGYNGCLAHWAGVSPKWHSTNPNIVTVDYRPEWGSSAATLVGRTPGTASIVTIVDDGSAKTSEFGATVTVMRRPPPDALYVRGNEFMSVRDTWQFEAFAEWSNPINRNDEVTIEAAWKSSNRAVATVSATGNVMTHAVGKAIISAELSGVRTDVTLQVAR